MSGFGRRFWRAKSFGSRLQLLFVVVWWLLLLMLLWVGWLVVWLVGCLPFLVLVCGLCSLCFGPFFIVIVFRFRSLNVALFLFLFRFALSCLRLCVLILVFLVNVLPLDNVLPL